MTLPLDELVENPRLVNERAQSFDWEDLLLEYEKALDDVQAWLRGLHDEQARFKPAPNVFSIAEVVTHNAFSDELFWNWVKLLAYGRGSEIDAKQLISGAGARNDLLLAALGALSEACRTLARSVVDALPQLCDLHSTAPHPYFGKMNAKGWIYFMSVHHGMHLRQCEAVIDSPDFPRSQGMQSQPREVYQSSARKVWLTSEIKSRPRTARTAAGSHRGPAERKKLPSRKTASKKSGGSMAKPKTQARKSKSQLAESKERKANHK
jgi:hypothetical protein